MSRLLSTCRRSFAFSCFLGDYKLSNGPGALLHEKQKGDEMLKLPITGFAQRVPDTVARAMNILKDRKDPAIKPQSEDRSKLS